MRNNANVDFIDINFIIVRFVKVKSLPAVREHLTPKQNADFAIDETTLVRNHEEKISITVRCAIYYIKIQILNRLITAVL